MLEMDNGRLKIESYKGIVYCEAYLDIEYTADDVQSIIDEAKNFFSLPVDVILKKAGSYSLSTEAQVMLMKHVDEFRHFVYVVDDKIKKGSAEYAITTYMKSYNTRIATTKEEAYEMLVSGN